jgi:hypothetical protein
VARDGKVLKNGIHLWHFHSDAAKSWVHGRVQWVNQQLAEVPAESRPAKMEELSNEAGAWSVYSGIEDDYCKQIVGEQRVSKPSGAVVWLKTYENHKLDAEALAYVAARTLGAGRRSQRLVTPSAVESPQQATSQRPRRRLHSRGLSL